MVLSTNELPSESVVLTIHKKKEISNYSKQDAFLKQIVSLIQSQSEWN